jgi:glycosyltransferase involved in cell wall biosynthesis
MEIIHIVLGKANPDRLNGVNKVVFHLATEQSKAGKKVQVWGVTPNPVHDYPERNFKTVLFQAESFPFAVNATLKKAILSNRNSVFHLHGGWIPLFSSLSGILAKNHIKYVLTPHGAYNEVAMKRSSFQKKSYFHLFEKSLLQRVHKVHAIGKSEVEGLNHIFPNAHSFLLPYGFDLNMDSIKPVKNKDFTIGFVGRLDTHTKGLDLLMEAYFIFQKKYPGSKLWIIGEGEGQAYLENFIAQKQLKNVVLWGKKFGAEKDALIGKMHVFAHPSRNEGLPTAVLEAAALCTPTIVTQATNVAEYVTQYKAGIGIENESINALEKSMEEIYNAYQSGQMDPYIQGAKEMLENVFAWPVLVEKFDELYR